jgi:hypothetical protein
VFNEVFRGVSGVRTAREANNLSFVMYPIRERIERAEAAFCSYNEMLEKAQEWCPALSGYAEEQTAPNPQLSFR